MMMTKGMEYIAELNKRGSVPGLDNIKALLKRLNHPECNVPVIHIAGTNGKGSTLAFIESICRQAGLRTGKYTSPTIASYYERFQIDGENIPEETFEALLMRVKAVSDEIERELNLYPTAFEVETAVAFCYCAQADVMLLETGMGGRLDSTNVVPAPLVTVLASISMDHMQYLGNTVSEIAREKAGILRPGVACVSNPANARDEKLEMTIRECCNQVGASYVTAQDYEVTKSNADHTVFIYEDARYEIHMPGLFQVDNAVTAILAVREAVLSIESFAWKKETVKKHWETAANAIRKGDVIREGLAAATWQARFERADTSVELYLDGAHNVDACVRLRESVEKYFTGRYMICIIGVLRDKEYEKMMGEMAPLADEIYTVTPDSPRALPAYALAGECEKYCDEVTACDSVGQAYAGAKAAYWRRQDDKPVILAFGSLSYLGELKKCMIPNPKAMDRFNQLLHDNEVIACYKRLDLLEQNRIYCRHGLCHALDVARIGYIMMLEAEDVPVSKELFYVMALLHDLGRVAQYEQGTPHHEAGVRLAEHLLSKYAFAEEEKTAVCEAIAGHNDKAGDNITCDNMSGVAEYLYLADKRSRNCFCCAAVDSCNWSEEKKNYDLFI